MLSKSFVLLSLLCLGAYAAPQLDSLVHHEKRAALPRGFVSRGPAPLDATLNLRISLVSNDIAGLEAETLAVSTPGNAKYGQHLSKEQVEAYVAPSQQTRDKVNAWLKANGLSASSISPAGEWLSLSVPVSKANTLLNADFTSYSHSALSTPTIRTMSYAIPAELKGHIDFIHPTVNFPVPAVAGRTRPLITTPVRRDAAAVPAACITSVTPSCLQTLYNIPTTKATQMTNMIGVTGLVNQYANYADLQQFLTTYRPDLTYGGASNFTLQVLDDGVNPQTKNTAGTEANLDIQYVIGLASNVPTTFISVGGNFNDTLDGFLDQIEFLLAQSNPPHVLTTSYTINEDDVGTALSNSLCNAYMQLSARGTSILFASGDAGVSGSWDLDCSGSFLPSFPNGCPWMTSVGSTAGIPEKAAYYTAGGFSNTWSVPSWQANATSAYIKSMGSMYSGMYNSKGRGFPDVSVQGEYLQVVVNGKATPVSGTSASAPVFAAIVGLVNDRLVAAGKSPLGFLNPFLYSAAGMAAFNDITSGNNPGCNTNGFNATKGWDPVSGLGTPDFTKLLTAVGL